MNKDILKLLLFGCAAALGGYAWWVNYMDKTKGETFTKMLPDMKEKVATMLALAKAQNLPVYFLQGWRSPEESAANIEKGVSWISDPYNSYHVWGAAADFCAKNSLGQPYFPPNSDEFWLKLRQIGEGVGLKSLADIGDLGHFQLKSITLAGVRGEYAENYEQFLADNGVNV